MKDVKQACEGHAPGVLNLLLCWSWRRECSAETRLVQHLRCYKRTNLCISKFIQNRSEFVQIPHEGCGGQTLFVTFKNDYVR